MASRRLAGELPLILYENSIISCLYSYILCFILILCNHMLFSQIITAKLLAANLSFYVSSRHLTVKQSVKIGRNLPDNLSIFLVKISSCTNNYDSVENKKSENACFYQTDFAAWLSFFLYIIFLHALFRKVREVDA